MPHWKHSLLCFASLAPLFHVAVLRVRRSGWWEPAWWHLPVVSLLCGEISLDGQ